MEWGTENKREEDTILTLAIFALCGSIPFQCCQILVQFRKTKNLSFLEHLNWAQPVRIPFQVPISAPT